MIEIVNTAPLLTVQDTGRFGNRHLGIPRCGMMDSLALQRANLLLGNTVDAAGLEISAAPVTIRSLQDHSMVLMGSDMQASVNAQAVLPGVPFTLSPGDVLTLTRPRRPGERAVLAVAGGIEVPMKFASRSTDLNNRFGGFQGRALKSGDLLEVGALSAENISRCKMSRSIRQLTPDRILRIIPGPDIQYFSTRAQDTLFQNQWWLTPQSNRMGLRLEGATLAVPAEHLRLSCGVLPGQIQVPASGQPVILANDAQSTGGYPVIASVINADLWKLAYLTPGDPFVFREVSVAEAQGLAAAQAMELQKLRQYLSWGQT
ncbi:biotin-dependent carboxyltransferase family protein [Pseudohongiella spirulinae]|uniref:Urea amidolyase related protein n=1 Tax=Pseudohongiella spirulinae TaxID=1249552 RepID=A0A0S2KFB2_9GAMM|nr:biotin-dependent carboxyltransferase family protein [Pseudohongiella spirulinae]ALO47020.1 Urea amidolyase related protein [Pseudohongiella spirulinae]